MRNNIKISLKEFSMNEFKIIKGNTDILSEKNKKISEILMNQQIDIVKIQVEMKQINKAILELSNQMVRIVKAMEKND